MKLYYDKRLSDPTYYAQQGYRNGKKTTTRNVKKFGKHSQLLLTCDDPLAYVKEEIRKMNEANRVGNVAMNITCNFNEKVTPSNEHISKADQANVGYFYIQSMYQKLALPSFFDAITTGSKVDFDCNEINRFLTYERILNPTSTSDMFDKLDTYFEKPAFSSHHISCFMDILESYNKEYLAHLFQYGQSIVKSDSTIRYYASTSPYFESTKDEDAFFGDVSGECLKGNSSLAIHNEHRASSAIEMGLMMDDHGIPISMCLHSNRTNNLIDIPMEKEVRKMMQEKRLIYCADEGFDAYHANIFKSMGGHAFIITQSIHTLSDTVKEVMRNDSDYKLLSNDHRITIEDMKSFDQYDKKNLDVYDDYAYKIVEEGANINLEPYEENACKNEGTDNVKLKVALKTHRIITFSRKKMEHQRLIRNRQIRRAKELVSLKEPKAIKKEPEAVRRFVKRASMMKDGKEVSSGFILDVEKIIEEEKYDGYDVIVTNVDEEAKKIVEIVRDGYLIKDFFHVRKTAHPSLSSNQGRMEKMRAHYLIGYTALLTYRLLKCKIGEQNMCITDDQLIKTLKNMNVSNLHDCYYMALYQGSRTLSALERSIPLLLDKKWHLPKEMTKQIKKLVK